MFSSDAVVNRAFLASVAGSSASATLDGRTLSGNNQYAAIYIGQNSSAVLNIVRGGSLSFEGTVSLGANAGSYGEVNVKGAGSEITTPSSFIVGNLGTGVLNVTDGAVVNVPNSTSGMVLADKATGSGTLNIAGAGSTVTGRTVATGSGVGVINIANGGALKLSGYVKLTSEDSAADSIGMLNIKNGTLEAAYFNMDASPTDTSGNDVAMLNVLGSGSDITFNNSFNYSTAAHSMADVNFYIDSTTGGVSTINGKMGSSGGKIDLGGEHHVTAMGFAMQDTANVFTLFAADGDDRYIGTFGFSNDTPDGLKSNGLSGGAVTFGFDPDAVAEWDIEETRRFVPEAGMEEDGWVRITGDSDMGVFLKLEFAADPTDELVGELIDYLNGGARGTGGRFLLVDQEDNEITVMLGNAENLFSSGYNIIGWGLSAFNGMTAATGTSNDVSLQDILLAPEPSTWAMLLMGAGCIVYHCRRRKQK